MKKRYLHKRSHLDLIKNNETKILKEISNNIFFSINKISLNLVNKELIIDNKKINCKSIDREKLWKILLN